MPVFNSPTSFFVGNLNAKDKRFEKLFFLSAKKNGYDKFIEPCSGELAMSQIAIESGFTDIEASDVTLFSTLLGFYVMGEPIDRLQVNINGLGRCDDIVEILYYQMLFKLQKHQGSCYYDNMIRDVELKKEQHKERIKSTLDLAKEKFGSYVKYRQMDMTKHMMEVYDNPKALVVMNFPTYKGGYEKNFDTGGMISWKEPEYELFDPKTGKEKIKKMLEGSKCLVLFYEEAYTNETVFSPLYVRAGAQKGMNTYITTNNIEKARGLVDKKFAVWLAEKNIKKLDYPLMEGDYEFTEESNVQVIKVGADVCNYYRTLLTHNFVGTSTESGYAVIVDGKVLGVFGYSKAFSAFFGDGSNDSLFVVFGMAKPVDGWRTNRLLTALEKTKEVAYRELNDLEKYTYKKVKTTMISKYPESKQMRGLMKRIKKEKDPKDNMFRLVYESELTDETISEAYRNWLKKETDYRKSKR